MIAFHPLPLGLEAPRLPGTAANVATGSIHSEDFHACSSALTVSAT